MKNCSFWLIQVIRGFFSPKNRYLKKGHLNRFFYVVKK